MRFGSIRSPREPATGRAPLEALLASTCLGALALAGAPGCAHGGDEPAGASDARPSADAAPSPDGRAAAPDGAAPGTCAAGPEGTACLVALHDEVAASCDPERLEHLRASLEARRGALPVWHQGRALFVTRGGGAAIAGSFNDWDPERIGTLPLCESDLWTAVLDLPSGHHLYKLVRDGVWTLDPDNWAFAYDDFAGNADGRNSVVNSYDSGVGELVSPTEWLCSDALDDCRPLTVYLPPGYRDPAHADRRYPTIFLQDGQNVFDDGGCCPGGSGWELNRTLDAEIAAGAVTETIAVGFDHGGARRIEEYGGALLDAFLAFQVETVQPTASSLWRIDGDRVYTAGSSLGGYVAYRLAYAHPDLYAGAAALSGSFSVGEGDPSRHMRSLVEAAGAPPLALYLDHGGTAEDGADGHAASVALRDALVASGFVRGDAPACAPGPGQLCYHHEPGGAHTEAAWRARAWRFLRFLVPAS